MGGLWDVPVPSAGTGPGGGGKKGKLSVDRKSIFLVPQRIYCVIGTLADQISYPNVVALEDRTPQVSALMQECLELVGVAYLTSREEGDSLDTKKVWEDVLSLGEQQRIGMARLFYHKPAFGILDECTSAVSQEVEEGLYKTARSMGITCITISQRLALEQFHTQQLHFGADTKDGWELRQISHSSSS